MAVRNKSFKFIFYFVLCIVLLILAVFIPVFVLNSYSYNYNYSKKLSKGLNDVTLVATYSNLIKLWRENAYISELHIIAKIDAPTNTPIPVYELQMKTGKKKRTMLILSGFDANDWVGAAALLFVIREMTRNCKVMSKLLTRFDFNIVPIWNPLGFNSTPNREAVKPVNMRTFGTKQVDKNGTFQAGWADPSDFSKDELSMMGDYLNKNKKNIEIVFILTSLEFAGKSSLVLFPYPTSDWMFMEYVTNLAAKSVDGRFKSVALNFSEPESKLSPLGKLNAWIINHLDMGRVINIQTQLMGFSENSTNTTAELGRNVITMITTIIKRCYVD